MYELITAVGVSSAVGMAVGYVQGRARGRKTINKLTKMFMASHKVLTDATLAIVEEQCKVPKVTAMMMIVAKLGEMGFEAMAVKGGSNNVDTPDQK